MSKRIPSDKTPQAPNQTWFATAVAAESAFTNRFFFEGIHAVPELARCCRMVTRFGFLGFVFGMAYVGFYLFIGHPWGALIITICSLLFAVAPLLMKATKSLRVGGHLLWAVMLLGFSALCVVENGLFGHAIAWLASVPLCALLLVGENSAILALALCFAVGSTFAAIEMHGITLPELVSQPWKATVSTVGYFGLGIFLFTLGIIFERGRKTAYSELEMALSNLETANQELVVLNKEKNEFLGMAAHDLRNPLSSILFGAQILAQGEHSAEVTSMAELVIKAARQMLNLINQLLDANAIEAGAFSAHLEQCDLAALTQQCLENNKSAADHKKIAFEFHGEKVCWAKAAPTATQQILDNLVSNSVKYSPFNTVVRLTAFYESGKAAVSVKDEGPGISAEDQAKMFRKFGRLSARPTGGESSTGLGLSIVRQLADAMAGSVVCESTLGMGACFTLYLPEWDGMDEATITD